MKPAWIVLCAALCGCAGSGVRDEPPAPTRGGAAFSDWRVDGRVAIQRGNEGWSAKLRWHRAAERFRLRLIAPLGRGTYQLAGDDRHVELSVPDGRTFVSRDPQALMDEHLGWSIPVSGAEYWLRGLVAPTSEPRFVHRDDNGLLKDFEQDGWRVSVLKRTQIEGHALPAKLFMHHGDLKVRIVVASWTLDPA